MSEERLGMIRGRLQEDDAEHDGEHIGLLNVHRRIVRLFGDDFGMSIQSAPGDGTRVMLRLPLRPQDAA
ncbi:hypothetical protein D3C71_2232270 [compost metagenome]